MKIRYGFVSNSSSVAGTIINVPEGHNPENESLNHCIFCGLPDERK